MLRTALIKLAHEVPELRAHLVPLLRQAAKSPTEEGAKKLFEEYRNGLKSRKTTRTWKDFFDQAAARQQPGQAQAEFLPDNDEAWEEWGDQFDRRPLDKHPWWRTFLAKYSDDMWGGINTSLREGKPTDYVARENIYHMDKIFASKAAKTPTPIKVRRGIDEESPLIQALLDGSLKKGAVFQDQAFMSTSVSSSWHWSSFTMEIAVPAGTRGVYLGRTKKDGPLSYHNREHELLLDRGTKVRVVSFDPKSKIVQCEVIEPDKKHGKPPWGER